MGEREQLERGTRHLDEVEQQSAAEEHAPTGPEFPALQRSAGNSARALLDQVADFLDRDGWSPVVDDGFVTCGFQGDHGQFPVYVTVIEEQERIVVYSVFTEHVPDYSRRDVAELFMRINFTLLVGSFDLDMDDGEARFRTSLDIEGGTLTDGLLKQLIYANVTTMDEYWPAIGGVASTTRTIDNALADVGGP